jgi:uncharacterized protein (DUF2336 family)
MLKRLRRFFDAWTSGAQRYEKSRAALETHAHEARLTLAGRAGTEPEILYYLSGDPAADVRSRVAANPSTPQHANLRLTQDPDPDVRGELARKIARLVPNLSADESQQVRDLAVEVMETLARDAAASVRAILAQELKAATNAPAHVIQALARDLDGAIAAPVLEFSPLLSDVDLLEIVAGARAQSALTEKINSQSVLTAIARRNMLASPVADAIVETYDVPAIAALLTNGGARLRQDTVDRIAERAAENVPWHKPLVLRPGLSLRAITRLAEFVSANLLEALERQGAVDAGTKAQLRARMTTRLKSDVLALDKVKEEARAADQIRKAQERKALDAVYVMELVEEGARAALVQALAVTADIHPAVVEKILASRSGKAIAALVWRAGFNARLALKIQTLIAHVPAALTVLPRDGEFFAIPHHEMNWHLEFFGVKPRT